MSREVRSMAVDMEEKARRQQRRAERDPVKANAAEDEANAAEDWDDRHRMCAFMCVWIGIVFLLCQLAQNQARGATNLPGSTPPSTVSPMARPGLFTPLDRGDNDLGGREYGSADLASEPDDAPDNAAKLVNESTSTHMIAPTVEIGLWGWIGGWIDWLFVWTLCFFVYASTVSHLSKKLRGAVGDALRGEEERLHPLVCSQGALISSCVQRAFHQTHAYETPTALAKRLVIIHVFTLLFVSLAAYCRVLVFRAVWAAFDEWVQTLNGWLSLHSVQIRQGRSVNQLSLGTMYSYLYPTLLLVIHLVFGCFDGLRAYPWSVKIVSSFVCMLREYPKFHVDILLQKLQVKSYATPIIGDIGSHIGSPPPQLPQAARGFSEIQYSVFTALLVMLCWPDEVIMASLAHQGLGTAYWLMQKRNNFDPFTECTALVLVFSVFTVFLFTEQLLVHDIGLHASVGARVVSMMDWFWGSWLWFVLVSLMCCIELMFATVLCGVAILQCFRDKLLFVSKLNDQLNDQLNYQRKKQQTKGASDFGLPMLCISLTDAALRLNEIEAWYSLGFCVAIEFPKLFSLCQGLRLMCTLRDIRWLDLISTGCQPPPLPVSVDGAAKACDRKCSAEGEVDDEHEQEPAETSKLLAAKEVTVDGSHAAVAARRRRVAEMVAGSIRLREAAEDSSPSSQVDVGTLQHRITKQSQALEAARKEKEALKHRITMQSQALEAAREEKEALRHRITKQSETLEAAREEKEALQHRITEVTTQRDAAHASHEELYKEMTAGIREAANAACAETETLRRVISNMTTEISGLREAADVVRVKDDQATVASVGATAAPRAADAVVDVLRRIGIERHAALFAAHEVDCETLFLLETNDLKELGLPFGAVVKLREWMGRNAKDAGATTEAAHYSECAVCMERRPVQCALVPCGHLSVCLDCSGGLAACPICRRGVERVLAVFPP